MKTYLCIDLKSFYASVECVARGLDPLKVNLVVADPSRGKGGICLAITPAMKALGIRNRCRIFEIPTNVSYITALPRMKKYMVVSSEIYGVYLKYVSPEDIHPYSIDECFIDITNYLSLYNISAIDLAKKMIKDVFDTTGITATAGIGTNLFLCKLALDITAKHSKDGIGILDEEEFKKQLWHHKPITDIWNISRGTANRLLKYGVNDLYGITQLEEGILYKEFGVNAKLIIDHANGIETCTIEDIKNYKSKNTSLSTSQILFHDYNYEDALLALKEMVDLNSLELIDKEVVTNSVSLMVRYSKDTRSSTGGVRKLDGYTQSRDKLMKAFIDLYNETTDKNYPIRGLGVSFNNIKDEAYESFDLFTDEEETQKEKALQKTILSIKEKFGKNSILKGMNLEENATTIKRNKLIGGHNSGEEN